jgi:hypothetical protein
MTELPKEIVEQAEKEFVAYIARRRKKGENIVIIKPPYHGGLRTVRGVIEADGVTQRVFFNNGSWRKV